MSDQDGEMHDEDDLQKGHVRHQEQARPLGKSIKSDKLSKTEDSKPLSRQIESEPLRKSER